MHTTGNRKIGEDTMLNKVKTLIEKQTCRLINKCGLHIHSSHLPGPHHHIHCHNHPHLHHHLQSLPDTADIQKLNLKNPMTTLVNDNEYS